MFQMTIILLVSLLLRIYGIDWDQGLHLHPDERMLMIVADRINFFTNLDPDFFNYGSLPVYMLKILFPKGDYNSLLLPARYLSVTFDLLTVFFVYLISLFLFKEKKIAVLSSLFYSLSFFTIQNSHFFVVDVYLTTFTTILVYLLLRYFKNPTIKKIILISIVLAAMLATKFTSIIFLPFIIGLIIFKTIKKLKILIISLIIFNFSFLIFNFLFMPYSYLKYNQFFKDVSQQLKMNSDPYVFPYTLQYVGSIPYLYYLKNMFLWGLGPIISVLTLVGLYKIIRIIINPLAPLRSRFQNQIHLSRNKFGMIIGLFMIFYLFYFIVVGRTAVKFMRYMLPLYPFFAILAGYGFSWIYKNSKLLAVLFMSSAILWTFTFITIYSKTHTRITATQWILKNIPSGSTLAIEHWDDRIPIYGSENYNFQELTFYDVPDDLFKWRLLNEKLEKSDYLIIASNRLYIPLQKLDDCSKYILCYPMTSRFYQKLFYGKLRFEKIAEFTVSPLFIDDQSADESFTVYDHPKIMIFKKLH